LLSEAALLLLFGCGAGFGFYFYLRGIEYLLEHHVRVRLASEPFGRTAVSMRAMGGISAPELGEYRKIPSTLPPETAVWQCPALDNKKALRG
jgi:hypothetical protein